MIRNIRKIGLAFISFLLILTLMEWSVPARAQMEEQQLVPAFPGAEGYGKYTSGGRGGDVYHVTNLNDSGPGSLRDAVSKSNRTIVFEVSGNIMLESPLRITGSNLTIAGQTAPGDGITVNNHSTYVEGNNIIIRYMRFRMGDRTPSTADAFSARNRSDLIIDHSSMSWGVDEVASIYDMRNVTVQNSIIAEALHMTNHDKGRHGFGGLWGSHSSYLNNIIAHNSSRNPRFKGTNTNDKGYDFRNNIIYNWNFYAGYGGNEADVNIVNNYYKYGPDTLLHKRSEIVELPDGVSNWYIDGNYVYGYPDVTEDNWLGVKEHPTANRLEEPVDVPEATTRSALEAFEYVLNNAGSTIPKRDSIDARIVADIRNGTGRQINSIDEVGAMPELFSTEAPLDSNRDGIPDYWHEMHGIDPFDDAWAKEVNEEGYTNLEVYLNSIVSDGEQNPDVRVVTPSYNEVFETGGTITIEAEASVDGAEIEKVVFYAGIEKLGEATAYPYGFTWTNVPEGTHYVLAKAISNKGRSTDATAIPIHVNTSSDIAPWSSTDIGELGIPGHSTIVDGRFIVKGDGNITGPQESFHYMYQAMSRDMEITAKIERDTKVAPHNREGVMIRASLEPGAPMAMTGISVRGDDRVGVFYHRAAEGEKVAETNPIVGPTTPYWVRLNKIGDIVTGYISADGEQWQLVSSMTFPDVDEVYVGLVADAANENNLIHNLNRVEFSNVTIEPLLSLPLYPQQFYISRGEQDLLLRWSAAERAERYHIQRSLTKGGPYKTIATVEDTQYLDSDLEADVNYYYVIRAANQYGDSVLTSAERNGALLGSQQLLTRLVDDDFEDMEIGTIPEGYDSRPNTETNYVVVEQVPEHSIGNDSNKMVMLYDNSSAHTYWTRDFEPQRGRMVLEVDYMQQEMSTFARAIRIMDGGKNNIEIFTGTGRGCEFEYCWYFRYQGDAAIIPANNRFSLNEWYHVRVEADVPNQQFDLYINGTHSGTLPFQGTAASLNRFESHTWGTSNQYLDHLQISSMALPAPQHVEAGTVGGAVELSWSTVDQAEYYNIYRKREGDRFQSIATEVAGTQYTDSIDGFGTYTYAIAAFNRATGEGGYSIPVTVSYDPSPIVIQIHNERHHSQGFDDQAPVGEYAINGSLSKPGTLYVDGQEVSVQEDLSFTAIVELRPGRNRIELTAFESAGEAAEAIIWNVVATQAGHSGQ